MCVRLGSPEADTATEFGCKVLMRVTEKGEEAGLVRKRS